MTESTSSSLTKTRGTPAHLAAIIYQRCPRCFEGKIFRGPFAMNDPCPVCGLVFQREEGYFLGAMYVSYALSSAVLICGYFISDLLFPQSNAYLRVLAITLLYLPLVPAVFRYSRVVWIHFDRTANPGDTSASLYEKTRRQVAKDNRNVLP